ALEVSKKEILDAYRQVSQKELSAIRLAKQKLETTEKKTKSTLKSTSTNFDGTTITKEFVPIQSVGCYVPGGLARYPSSAIMSVVPAKVAGVKEIIVVSPPTIDGTLDPLTIVAANMAGATKIYNTGGAQAIGALSYGTKSIPKVDKIVGPGGAFVTLAKSIVSYDTAIDMLAGPTELGIIADNSADPNLIAIDLISQAEHSSDTFCYLVTDSVSLAKKVNEILKEKIKSITRSKIVSASLKKNGFIAICKNVSDMINLANTLAPEHLQIMTKNPSKTAKKITSAGLVLVGEQTPSAASDYILGSNHILPTNRFGKTRGSLSVLDFVKISTHVTTSKKALTKLSKHMKSLTDSEGLPNHYESVRSRIK
nr:histidinol dehydrogenase [Nitrosopumilaceae archaeon]NIU01382.1 histidinol dehydrogenase [Nitrosopumilaceae archaeon]NIU87390.1 histidinol dehydrogenase [Nitrosopumilaceae archaeon]NIV65916.1 histidinol dehydrogenase [Nitrosopumilaceae archaeon]NIX61984.1 histidinol dehydrogenase [Nitrosopumilaceae archaeon]